MSLTHESREGAETFVQAFSVPWPCGYGATLPFLAQLGTYSAKRMSANYNPGYEVSPTVYLIDSDGRIRWSDDQARPNHTKDSETLVRDIDAAIERVLADLSSSAWRQPAPQDDRPSNPSPLKQVGVDSRQDATRRRTSIPSSEEGWREQMKE